MSSSDSSESEDLSRFKDVVDTSFVTSLNKKINKLPQEMNLHSKRYLDTSTHYNDIKVPEKLQNQITAKISAILDKTIEYIDVKVENTKDYEIKGGIKLFTDSKEFLTSEEICDTYTENHNNRSKKLKQETKKRHLADQEFETLNEKEKINSVAVSGKQVLSKEEIKHWKSRRKEKVYKYKTMSKSKALIAVD